MGGSVIDGQLRPDEERAIQLDGAFSEFRSPAPLRKSPSRTTGR